MKISKYLLESPQSVVDMCLGVLGITILLNVILATVLDVRELGFKLVSMWIVLVSLCLVNKKLSFSAIFLGLVLACASEAICYFGVNQEVFYQKIAPVLIADLVVLIFFDLLAAIRVENAVNARDVELNLFNKTQTECLEIEEKLKESDKEGAAAKPKREEDRGLELRRLTLNMQKVVYNELLAVRRKSDIAKFVERLFSRWFKVRCGMFLELASGERNDHKILGTWGVSADSPEVAGAFQFFLESQILKKARANREFITAGEMHKDPALFAELQQLTQSLFDLYAFIPITGVENSRLMLIIGQPQDPELPFDYKVVQPILAATTLCQSRIGNRE